MAGPNPIVIDFIVEDLNKVLSAMRSIQNVAMGIERKSTTATQAGADARSKARNKELQNTAQAAAQAANVLKTAERAGTAELSKQLRARLNNHIRHIQALKAQEDAHVGYQRKLKDQWAKNSSTKEQQALSYQRSLRQQHFADLHNKEKKAANNAIAEGKRVVKQAEKDAQARQDFSVDVHKKLLAAERRAHFDAKLGGNADPRFSPQERLRVLRDVIDRGRFRPAATPEEKLKALQKEADMREEAKIANKRKSEADALAKAKGKADRDEQRKTNKEREQADRRARSEKSREEKRAQKDQEREQKKVDKERAREEKRAKTEVLREEARKSQEFRSSVRAGVEGAGSIVGRATMGAFRTVTDLGGGFSVGKALQERVDLDREAARLSVASRVPGQKSATQAEILERVSRASSRTGTDRADLMSGLKAYTAQTGNFSAGAENLEFFGKISKATGSSLSEVMGTAGAMTVQNRQLGAGALGNEALKKLILSTVMQARQGSVEFEHMAAVGNKVTRSAVAYSGDQAENQNKLLGLSQIGMRVTGKDAAGVSEAATMLANIEADATKHSGAVERLLGRKFKNDRGQIIGGPDKFIGDLLEAAMSKKGGLSNLDKEDGDGKAFFGARSRKMFQALGSTYNAEYDRQIKSGASEENAKKAGAQAVRADMAKAIGTQYGQADLEKEVADIMKTSAEKFEAAVRDLKVGVADKLLPELVNLIPVLQALTPVLVNLISFLSKLTGTEDAVRAESGKNAVVNAANDMGALRPGSATPEAIEKAKEDLKALGKSTEEREKTLKGFRAGRVFELAGDAIVDAATLGNTKQFTKTLSDNRAADKNEQALIAEQKEQYKQLALAIAQAAEELKKIKAPDTGGPAPPAAPVAPMARR